MQHNLTPPGQIESPIVVPATIAAIARAGALIAAGGLVAFPTETVYGLGADATNGRAVAAIFEAKGRPRFNPLIIHLADLDAAAELARFDSRAEELAAQFWPGPLTLILLQRAGSPISELATAGLGTVAIRLPSHPIARELIHAAGRPIAAPSANRSGRVSPTTAIHAAEELEQKVGMVLAGGRSAVGLESTILDLTGPAPILLRPGVVTQSEIAALIGPVQVSGGDAARPNALGQLKRHYAPDTLLRLNASAADPGEALLAFGPAAFAARHATRILNLSETGDLHEAAANFFSMLRMLDAGRHRGIAVMAIPDDGVGAAINDRLRRAAALENSDV